jgi:hypothetical protein
MENGKWKMELQKIYFSEKSYSSSFYKTTFTLQKKFASLFFWLAAKATGHST